MQEWARNASVCFSLISPLSLCFPSALCLLPRGMDSRMVNRQQGSLLIAKESVEKLHLELSLAHQKIELWVIGKTFTVIRTTFDFSWIFSFDKNVLHIIEKLFLNLGSGKLKQK